MKGLCLFLKTAAYVHDIGIKISEEKYNSSAGKYQEIEGPPIAEEMLTKLGYDKKTLSNVCHTLSVIITHIQISTVSTIKYLLRRTSLSI